MIGDEHREMARHDCAMVCAPTSELRPPLRRRQIEMAFAAVPDVRSDEVVREERFVWVANEAEPAILRHASVPLALSALMTLDYSDGLRRDGSGQPALPDRLRQQ